VRRWKYTPDVILDLASRRLAGQSHRSLSREFGGCENHMRAVLRDVIPSCYPRQHYNPQAEVTAERIGNAI
jgi:hypothetical protein